MVQQLVEEASKMALGGNRHLNAALYRIAVSQTRYHPAARDYLERERTP